MSSASDKNAVKGGTGRKRTERRGSESRYWEVEGDGSTKAGCCEPHTCLCSARKVESLSDSDGSGSFAACEVYTTKKVPIAMIDVTSSTT